MVVDPFARSDESLAYLESKISQVISSGTKIIAQYSHTSTRGSYEGTCQEYQRFMMLRFGLALSL